MLEYEDVERDDRFDAPVQYRSSAAPCRLT